MRTAPEDTVTVGEAARRLGTHIDELLDLVYKGQLQASPERKTGRLLIREGEVERLRVQRRSQHTG